MAAWLAESARIVTKNLNLRTDFHDRFVRSFACRKPLEKTTSEFVLQIISTMEARVSESVGMQN